MVRIVVVGGGFAGLSAAARLAKLRHDVILLEATDRLGGRLRGIEVDGIDRPADPESFTLPGVVRDLFRKSGRPLERVLDIAHGDGRRHVFADRTVLDLPFGDRASQHDALVAALGADDWSPWVDAWPERWDVLRRTFLDRVPTGRDDLDKPGRRTLGVRRSLDRLEAPSRDERLEHLVIHHAALDGQDLRLVPGVAAVEHYLERNFGRYEIDGGFPALADALTQRLTERKVTVELSTTAHELAVDGDLRRGGRITGVVTDQGAHDADVVVWCAPTWPAPLRRPPLMPVIPSSRTFATLGPEAPPLPRDLVAHGKLPVRLFHTGPAADGTTPVTVVHRFADDPFVELARVGVDLRTHVEKQTRVTPAELVRMGHWGWQWTGWRSLDDVPGVGPRDDLHLAGAHAWSGPTIERIGMATAAIAESIGPAPR